jgi:hypothetical protein
LAAGLARLIPTPTVEGIRLLFLSEAILLSLFILTVAQVSWSGEQFEWIPGWFYKLLGWLFLLMLLCPVGHGLLPGALFPALSVSIFVFLAGLMILSLLLRAAMALRDRLK